jgi:hypothetical protein
VRLLLTASLGALSIGTLLWACSGEHHGPNTLGDTPLASASASPALACSTPSAGCPCTQPGEMLTCGEVVYKSERYVSCSLGTRTCQADGTWTDCQGNQVVTLNSWQLQDLKFSSQPLGVAANNTCDPSLFQINSVLGTTDASIDDGGVTVLDSGAITLTGNGATASGCGDAAPPPLVVTPAIANLQITQIPLDGALPSPNSVQFAASVSGCAGDGAVSAIWTMDQPGVAAMADGGILTLIYPYAGPIHVTAYAGTLSGTATANVTLNVIDTSKVADGAALTTSLSTTCGVDAGGGG